jgi:glutamate racemase
VIGTAGTIASGAYDIAVRKLVEDARVYAQPCPLFVPLIEEGWQEQEATRLVAERYLAPLHEVDVDVLILGCTHYPLIAPVIQDILGPKVTLVDSAHETALEVREVLAQEDALRTEQSPPLHSFYASDSPMRFRDVGRRFLGSKVDDVEKVVVEGIAVP